MLSVTTKRAKC